MLDTSLNTRGAAPPEPVRAPEADHRPDSLLHALDGDADPVELRRALLLYGTAGQAARDGVLARH